MATDSIQHVVSVEDGIPPLDIQSETEVFREQGGADFTVTRNTAVVRSTGERLQFHVASVRDGKTGAVCIAEQILPDGTSAFLLARHWRVSTSNGLGSFHEAWVPMMRILEILLSVSYLRKQESRFHGIRLRFCSIFMPTQAFFVMILPLRGSCFRKKIRNLAILPTGNFRIHSIFLPAPCVR